MVERSVNGAAFANLATVGPKSATGNVTYVDAAITPGDTYTYQVRAVNGGGSSGYSNTANVIVPTLSAAPSNVVATAVLQGQNSARVRLNWTDNSNNETGFRIQRATNSTFTANLVTSTVGANAITFQTGNVRRGTNFWFRVQSFNGVGPSAWVNATPFPILTP